MPKSPSLSHQEKLRIISDLIAVANADLEHRDEEYDFLHVIAERMNLEPMEMEKVFTSVEKHPAPQSEAARIRSFGFLLDMAAIDGEIASDELIIIRNLGFKLGLRLQAIDQSLKYVQLMAGAPLHIEQIEEIFNVHQN